MPKFEVLRNLLHDGKQYLAGKGQKVEMEIEHAAELVERGVLKDLKGVLGEVEVNPTGMPEPALQKTENENVKFADVSGLADKPDENTETPSTTA